MHVLRTIARLLGALVSAAAAPAHAGTSSASLEVSFTVLPGCSVRAAPLAFAAPAGSEADAEAAIDVRCSSASAVAVTLDGGRSPHGAVRHMTAEDGTPVAYAIYSDAARSRPWGAAPISGVAGPQDSLRLVAYGRVDASDSAVPAGEYRDTLTVTVAF